MYKNPKTPDGEFVTDSLAPHLEARQTGSQWPHNLYAFVCETYGQKVFQPLSWAVVN